MKKTSLIIFLSIGLIGLFSLVEPAQSSPLEPPVLESPADGASVSVTPLLEWGEVEGATFYSCTIFLGQDTIYDTGWIQETSVRVPAGQLEKGKTYSWIVRAAFGSDYADSEYRTFTTVEIIAIENPLEAEDFETIVDNIIDFIFKIAIVAAPLMAVIGGFLLVTAGGNIQQLSRAKSLLIWTAIGLLVVLLSKGILAIINQILGVQGG